LEFLIKCDKCLQKLSEAGEDNKRIGRTPLSWEPSLFSWLLLFWPGIIWLTAKARQLFLVHCKKGGKSNQRNANAKRGKRKWQTIWQTFSAIFDEGRHNGNACISYNRVM